MKKESSIYIAAAPSGAGKSSLVDALLEQVPNGEVKLCVSHTTRAPRVGEEDGVHYHFIQKEQFQKMIAEGGFLEHAEVFGNYYGTAFTSLKDNLDQGIDTFLILDWQGARQVKEKFPEETKTIFILPPSKKALEERLIGRGQDSEEVIARRMAEATSEISHYNEFDYVIVNDRFDKALNDLNNIVKKDPAAEDLTQENVARSQQKLIQDLLEEKPTKKLRFK